MPLAIGEFIHADAGEARIAFGIEARLPDTPHDPTDGAPRDAEDLRHRRDVRLSGQERGQLLHAMGEVRARRGPGHPFRARPPTATGTRDPTAPIYQVDSDRAPVEILPSPDRPWMVILRSAPATSGTAGRAPRRRHLDRQRIVPIHHEPTDVQLRDTDELFEYRCEAHGNLRWIVVCCNPTVQHVPVRLSSLTPAPSSTYAPTAGMAVGSLTYDSDPL